MLVLKDYFAGLLPDYILVNDSYKDGGGKGFVRRFVEILGEELDDYHLEKIESISTEYVPSTVTNPVYLEYFATLIGDIPRVLTDDTQFARLIEFMLSIFKIKGTIKSYKSLLTALGHTTVTIEELEPSENLYDDPEILYDDPEVLYDESCATCSEYNVNITTSIDLTGDNYKRVADCIALLEPINAKLKVVNWNGDPVNVVHIEVYVDENGDLIYSNVADPDLVLTLVNGDLIISGPNAAKYYLDEGDLYYIG